jgi:hypothetical protein
MSIAIGTLHSWLILLMFFDLVNRHINVPVVIRSITLLHEQWIVRCQTGARQMSVICGRMTA